MKIQVAAAVIKQNNLYLIAQRAKNDSFKGLWEFPGGKVEVDETLEQCLKRELQEELGIVAEIGVQICEVDFIHPKNNNPMRITAFEVTSFCGQLVLHEHEEVRWVELEQLRDYRFPDPDYSIIDVLNAPCCPTLTTKSPFGKL